MIDTLFQDSLIVRIVLNTLFVSIPEELYLVMFTLIMVGEFEYWKESECKRLINRFDYVRVFLPTIAGALISNILINAGLNNGFYQFLTPLFMYIIIVLTNDIFGDASAIKWMLKAFISYMIGFLSIGILELLYIPMVLYGTGITLEQLSNSFSHYFLLSLPSRFLQYSILLYLISKRRTLLKGRLIKNMLSSPILIIIFSFLVLCNIFFLWLMYNFIVYDKVLIGFQRISQIFIIIGIVSFPMLNISALLWGFYYMKNSETKDKKKASEKLYILLKEIEIYTNNENYDNIRWKLNEIGMGIKDVAQNLYKENETDQIT